MRDELQIARRRIAAMMAVAFLCPWVVVATAQESNLNAKAAATVRRYCLDCHGNDLAEARINLQQMTDQPDFGRAFKDWGRVVEVLRQGKMPPADAPQPNESERTAAATAVEQALTNYVARNANDPGPVVLRRLTSAEFDYTIDDLTGLDLKLGRRFVSDAAGGEGFTNAGAFQFMQDSTLQQYLESAKTVAEHAVIGAGPLTFFEHPGESGRELFAITRIKEIYQRTGFRTAAGEGALPYGLDQYPRAMLVAWRYKHREALGIRDATIEQLAREEGSSVRLCQHLWTVLNAPATSFPLSLIVAAWRDLPPPEDGKPTDAEMNESCQRLAGDLRQWQSVLAAASGDEEEAAVLTEGEVQIHPQHTLEADINWPEESKTADLELSVETASRRPATGALVVWRELRIRFRHVDNRRGDILPLVTVLAPESKQRLRPGSHPAQGAIGKEDFVIGGGTKVPVRLLVPEGTRSARLYLTVQLDIQHGSDAIVRCRIADGEVAGETAAEVGDTSTLLGNPNSPFAAEWRSGVADFARLLPEVSHREPTPSDRDPIPPPYDNTYNMPERNHFHAAIKYHRDDRFLVTHILDDATRIELDQAWADLLTSFDYHDANLRFVLKKFGIDLARKRIADVQPEESARLPAEPRRFIERLRDEHARMQRALREAEPGHLADAVRFARRAWRRPLLDEEESRLRGFYQALRHDELDHAHALRALLTRILVAPHFLYRHEFGEEDTNLPGRVAPLSDWDLANRLSYFLWSSLPDDELSRSAAAGELQDPGELSRQAKRMLRAPQARRLAAEFFGQSLGFYRFDEFRGIDVERFPEFSESLKVAIHGEAVSFFEHIVREDRPVSEILFADYTFLNAPLARHYGLDTAGVPEERHVRVPHLTEEHRGGLLGLAAVLATTSAPLRTSAVKRGDWVLRRVLGTPVPPPPADAGSIAPDDALPDGLTVRQRLEAHRSDRSCVNCHARIDPLGFALEHYDPLGRWRDQYRGGQPIDSSGTLSDGTEVRGLEGLRSYLRREQPQFTRNLCGKLLGYALGRAELASDRPLIEAMLSDRQQSPRFSELVVQIVTSRQFRYRRL